jgi:hypothetical protein
VPEAAAARTPGSSARKRADTAADFPELAKSLDKIHYEVMMHEMEDLDVDDD